MTLKLSNCNPQMWLTPWITFLAKPLTYQISETWLRSVLNNPNRLLVLSPHFKNTDWEKRGSPPSMSICVTKNEKHGTNIVISTYTGSLNWGHYQRTSMLKSIKCLMLFECRHVAKFYGRLRLIRSVLRTSKFFVLEIYWNCNFVGLLHHPVWLQLVLALRGITF